MIDEKLLSKLERLAMIEVEDGKKEEVKHQLSDILNFIEKIQKVNTDDISLQNYQKTPLRLDVVSDANISSDVLKNAPSAQDNFFIVPKIIE